MDCDAGPCLQSCRAAQLPMVEIHLTGLQFKMPRQQTAVGVAGSDFGDTTVGERDAGCGNRWLTEVACAGAAMLTRSTVMRMSSPIPWRMPSSHCVDRPCQLATFEGARSFRQFGAGPLSANSPELDLMEWVWKRPTVAFLQCRVHATGNRTMLLDNGCAGVRWLPVS